MLSTSAYSSWQQGNTHLKALCHAIRADCVLIEQLGRMRSRQIQIRKCTPLLIQVYPTLYF